MWTRCYSSRSKIWLLSRLLPPLAQVCKLEYSIIDAAMPGDFSPIRDSRTTQDFYCILRGRAVHHKALTMGPSLSTLCVQGDHGFRRSMRVTVAHDRVWYIQALIDNWKHLDFGMYMPACYLTSTPHAEVMWAWPCEPFLCVYVCVRMCASVFVWHDILKYWISGAP